MSAQGQWGELHAISTERQVLFKSRASKEKVITRLLLGGELLASRLGLQGKL